MPGQMWERLNTIGGGVTLLGAWLTLVALVLGWWWNKAANALMASTSTKTQELITATSTQTKEILERMNQLAEDRYRDLKHRLPSGEG